jgi:hypothetical protein
MGKLGILGLGKVLESMLLFGSDIDFELAESSDSISTSWMVGFGTNFWLVPVTNCCTLSFRERCMVWLA